MEVWASELLHVGERGGAEGVLPFHMYVANLEPGAVSGAEEKNNWNMKVVEKQDTPLHAVASLTDCPLDSGSFGSMT